MAVLTRVSEWGNQVAGHEGHAHSDGLNISQMGNNSTATNGEATRLKVEVHSCFEVDVACSRRAKYNNIIQM